MTRRTMPSLVLALILIGMAAALPLLAQENPAARPAASPVAAEQTPLVPSPAPPRMHRAGDADWVEGEHAEAFGDRPSDCLYCHGPALQGSPRSRARRRRVFSLPDRADGPVVIECGESVSCARCHARPALPKRDALGAPDAGAPDVGPAD